MEPSYSSLQQSQSFNDYVPANSSAEPEDYDYPHSVSRSELYEGTNPNRGAVAVVVGKGEPRQITSTTSENCCDAFRGTLNMLYFALFCCTFVVVSSVPRLLTLVDFTFSVLIFAYSCEDYNMVRCFTEDLQDGQAAFSAAALVILAALRTLILFFTFAYGRHRSRGAFLLATFTCVFCVGFVLLRLLVLNSGPVGDSYLSLSLWTIAIILIEYPLYLFFRAKRVKVDGGLPEDEDLPPVPPRRTPAYRRPPTEAMSIHGGKAASGNCKKVRFDLPPMTPCSMSDSMSSFDYALLSEEDMGHATDADHKTYRGVTHCDGMMRLEGLDVHYTCHKAAAAKKGAPVAVLVHGFGGSTFNYKPLTVRLLESGLVSSVICFDQPGFGFTQRLLFTKRTGFGAYQTSSVADAKHRVQYHKQDNPYTRDYSVKLTMLLMDALSIESAVLIGHSTGSSIALATALANPTRVKGLVLVSATDFKNGFPSLVRSLLKTQLGKDLMESLIRSEMGEIAIKRSWFCENDDIPLSVLDNYKLVSSQPNWHEALFLLAEASLDTQEDMALQLKQLVTTSEMPLLFMHGDQDRIVDVSESIELYNAVHEHAHTTFVELLNTGHVPHEEHSARVMSYLKDLLLAAASTDTR